MNMLSTSSFCFDFFFLFQEYNTNKCGIEYFVIHFQYEITGRFLIAILGLLVDHSIELLFSKLIMQYILYWLIAHLCN